MNNSNRSNGRAYAQPQRANYYVPQVHQRQAYPQAYQTSYQVGLQPTSHSSQYQFHPDIKLKTLPFYEVKGELLKPTTLIPHGQTKQQESSFSFHLLTEQANDLGMARDYRSETGTYTFGLHVQIRFCLIESTTEQEDCFPPGILLKVNNKNVALPPPIPTRQQGVEPKRPPMPLNVTQHIKMSPTVNNIVNVQWTYTDYSKNYCVSIYLVEKKTPDELLNRLKAKGTRPADFTRKMIKEKLNDSDCEIATTSLRVSLVCPLGKMKMTTPIRASTCQHLQCFDGILFLQMNEKKASWICPVCNKPALYSKLVIDGYFLEVINSPKLPSNVQEVQLLQDGSWTPLEIKEEVKNKETSKATGLSKEIEIDLDDDEPKAAKSSSEFVNLISDGDSDSDNEPLSKQVPVVTSSSSSKHEELSIITLDDDEL